MFIEVHPSQPRSIDRLQSAGVCPFKLVAACFLELLQSGRDSSVPNSARIHFLFMTETVGQGRRNTLRQVGTF
jgi:hypothetical protein